MREHLGALREFHSHLLMIYLVRRTPPVMREDGLYVVGISDRWHYQNDQTSTTGIFPLWLPSTIPQPSDLSPASRVPPSYAAMQRRRTFCLEVQGAHIPGPDAGSPGDIVATTDGGSQWGMQAGPPELGSLQGITCTDSTTCIAVGGISPPSSRRTTAAGGSSILRPFPGLSATHGSIYGGYDITVTGSDFVQGLRRFRFPRTATALPLVLIRWHVQR